MALVCFVCKNCAGNVIKFTELTLRKCNDILNARIKLNFKYKELILPANIDDETQGYHVPCYRKFSAISNKKGTLGDRLAQDEGALPSKADSHATRSQAVSLSASSAGVLAKVCIFCCKSRKKFKNTDQALIPVRTQCFERSVREAAEIVADFDLLKRIDYDLVAKEAHYHPLCWRVYRNHLPLKESCESKEPTGNLEAVLSQMMDFIREEVSVKRKAFLLSTLFKQFLLFYAETVGDECKYSQQHLETKIEKTFSGSLKISALNKQKKVIHHPELTQSQLLLLIATTNEQTLLKEAASKLRETIRNIEPTILPPCLTLSDVKKGETVIPQALSNFLTDLLCGPVKEAENERKMRLVESIAQDIIFAASNGRVKPSKHIMLGLTMSGLTSSRKVINILNRFGHTLSYTALEGLETELCYSDVAISESTLSPSSMVKSPSYATGVAFDNFDRYVETVSGKDTLHDTVGIAHQIYLPLSSELSSVSKLSDTCASSAEPSVPLKIKRRRVFEGSELIMEPYRKKPKFTGALSSVDDPYRLLNPPYLTIARQRDFLWMLSVASNVPNVPMWIGFNAKTIEDTSPLQKVFYLPPINQSPTSSTVVLETMKRAKQIASECEQESIIVTYDLAIAKVAYQIQCTEAPTFDNLFIQMGDFHTMMAFFHAVGKIIEDCGLTDVLLDSDIIASGSVSGFLKGKHYNRCKRIHPITSLALQILHFNSFVKSENLSVSMNIINELRNINETRKFQELSPELNNLLTKYNDYCAATLAGKHGKTAKFFFFYTELISYYLMFTRSIREGNFELYQFIIPKLINMFFALNQPNYARWLTKYHDNLMQIENTHPDLMEKVKSGCFAVRRTPLEFSRSPVDLTLEQTVNADAANKLVGISSFTNSISARERWARFHSIKAEIISSVLQTAGLTKRSDVTAELSAHRIKKDNEAVHRLTCSIERHVNPFDQAISKETLFNIATGKGAGDIVCDFLLNVENIGEKAKNEFIDECSKDPSRFEKPIKRQKIMTFVNEQKKCQLKSGDSKLHEEISNKNLFARLLAVSLKHKIDIAEVLKFPLSATPRALSHADGTMMKTDKSALMSHLEKQVKNPEQPLTTDAVLIDGFFLLHTIGEVPRTFGQISRKFLQMVTKYKAKNIFLIFDRYFELSIKNPERQRRGDLIQVETYTVQGPDQIKPSNFLNCLRNEDFKRNFVQFIISHWQDSQFSDFLRNKRLFVTLEEKCYEFKAENGEILRFPREEFFCEHEEADTRLFYVITKLQPQQNVIVRCNDTDVLIILLGNLNKIPEGMKIWLEVGFFYNNSLRFININQLFHDIGEDVSLALPGLHAFTGCDTTSSFFKKGKISPFKIMEKQPEFVDFFKSFANKTSPKNISTTLVEKFVCSFYGLRKCNTVNEARYRKFELAYKPKKLDEPLMKSFATFDSLSIPPCQSTLVQHLKRSMFQAYSWLNAEKSDPISTLVPQDYGWKIGAGGNYEPVWFEGDAAPPVVIDAIVDQDAVNIETTLSDDEYAASDCLSEEDEDGE